MLRYYSSRCSLLYLTQICAASDQRDTSPLFTYIWTADVHPLIVFQLPDWLLSLCMAINPILCLLSHLPLHPCARASSYPQLVWQNTLLDSVLTCAVNVNTVHFFFLVIGPWRNFCGWKWCKRDMSKVPALFTTLHFVNKFSLSAITYSMW